MSRYKGFEKETAKILKGLIAAAEDDPRLPELFSGAARKPGKPKDPYPSACAPQAWAAAAPFAVLDACMRSRFNRATGEMDVSQAHLPREAGRITFQDNRSADRKGRINLCLEPRS